jgi:hypothetical protein
MSAKTTERNNGLLIDIGANARVERCFRADAVDPQTRAPLYRWKVYRRTACAAHDQPDAKRGKFVHPLHGQRTHDDHVWMPAGDAASKEEAIRLAQAFAGASLSAPAPAAVQ